VLAFVAVAWVDPVWGKSAGHEGILLHQKIFSKKIEKRLHMLTMSI
jgi:hypothetical protein